MHQTFKQDYIAQAERQLAFVEQRIARQKRIIDELAQTGRRIAPSRCSMLWRLAYMPWSSIAR
jgi:hypothetical protein